MADPTDGKLVHLDGLNLSHAWMQEGIAAGLPEDDDCRPALIAAATVQWASGLASVPAHVHQMHCDSIKKVNNNQLLCTKVRNN